MQTAEILCDSISTQGYRLVTYKCRYPKYIHGEAKTHRVLLTANEGGHELYEEVGIMNDPNLSRNAASSRAIPISRNLKEVRSDEERACPIFWGKHQPGMGAREELTGSDLELAKFEWREAALDAANRAERMMNLGAAKEWANRILEPFLHITVVISGTEWENFFALRLGADAQPEIRDLAVKMFDLRKKSKPKLLLPGQWHTPYIDVSHNPFMTDDVRDLIIKVSTARVARTSYESFETGKRSRVDEDIKLYDRLLGSRHLSPFEHCATPDSAFIGWEHPNEHGNFVGWRQHRGMIPNQNIAPMPDGYDWE